MLIVEGADLVGKTTLAKRLVERLNELGWPHVYRHAVRPPASWRRDPVCAYEAQACPWAVQDRYHLSELAYRSVDGGEPCLREDEAELLEAQMPYATVLVVVAAPALIEARYPANAGRELYTLEQVLAANDWFRRLAEGRGRMMRTHVLRCAEESEWPWPALDETALRDYLVRLRTAGFAWPGSELPPC
jgi:hypothetical protein